jgi:hypothetical protein
MRKFVSLVEVTVFYSLVQILIWSSPRWRPPVILIGLIMMGICIGSNRLHKDSLERIGLKGEKLIPSAKLVAPWLVLLVPLIIAGWGKTPPEGWDFWFAILGYPIWGFAQEYVLLGFVANRLEDALPHHLFLVPWINGFLFSMAHLPNPILMGMTMVSGTVFTRIFLRERHLIPPALAHALFGIALSFAFGSLNGAMSVGPGYLSRIGTPLNP